MARATGLGLELRTEVRFSEESEGEKEGESHDELRSKVTRRLEEVRLAELLRVTCSAESLFIWRLSPHEWSDCLADDSFPCTGEGRCP